MMRVEDTIEMILEERPDESREALKRRVQDKSDELGPTISMEAIAMIVALEIGIEFSIDRKMIGGLEEGMKGLSIKGVVKRIEEPRPFQRKRGGEGSVRGIIVGDSTGTIRLVLWDKQGDFVEEDLLDIGDTVLIDNAVVKAGYKESIELGLEKGGSVTILQRGEGGVEESDPEFIDLSTLEEGMYDVAVKGTILRVSDITSFSRKDKSVGKVINATIENETGSVKVTFWDDFAERMNGIEPGRTLTLTKGYTKVHEEKIEVHSSRKSSLQID